LGIVLQSRGDLIKPDDSFLRKFRSRRAWNWGTGQNFGVGNTGFGTNTNFGSNNQGGGQYHSGFGVPGIFGNQRDVNTGQNGFDNNRKTCFGPFCQTSNMGLNLSPGRK